MNRVRSLSALCCALGSAAVWAALPAGYPASYQNLVDAAVKEGKVVVYSATDSAAGLSPARTAAPGTRRRWSGWHTSCRRSAGSGSSTGRP